MKRTGPEPEIQTNEEIQVTINELPHEVLREVFLRLDWAQFATLGRVSTLWHRGVFKLSQDLVRRYFPYLATLPAFSENPLKLLVQESRAYQRLFSEIEIDLKLAALSGNREVIAAIEDNEIKIQLYALFAANHHTLPEGLTQEDLKKICGATLEIHAFNGHLDALKEGIATLSAEKISSDTNGRLLKWAAQRDHLETVTYLLSLENIALKDKGTALMDAAFNGHLDVVKCLATLVEISPEEKGEALEYAAGKGHLEVVKYLALLAEISKEQALEQAAGRGYLEVVKCLAPLAEISTQYKGMALRQASQYGHLEVVKYLGPLAEISSWYKRWALREAAEHGHHEVVKFLLAQPAISVNDKQAALQCAQKWGHLEIVAAIQQNLTMPLPASPVYTPLQAAIASANNSLEPNRENNNNNPENAAKKSSSYPFSCQLI